MAAFFGIIVKYLGDDLLKALFGFISDELANRNLQVQGMQMQAAKDSAVTAKAQQSMTQAEADAPHSQAEVLTALDTGKF